MGGTHHLDDISIRFVHLVDDRLEINTLKRIVLCAVGLALLAGNTASAEEGFRLASLRLLLAGAYVPGFVGGFSRDPVTVEDSLGWGATIQIEFRRRSVGLEIEVSGLQFDCQTSVALYGGIYGTYERNRTVAIRRAGIGLNHHYRTSGRISVVSGVRVSAQTSGEYDHGYGFGFWNVAPHIGVDLDLREDSRWFLTADLQINLFEIDEVGLRVMPQISFGIGRTL
jgi:hypothetical protein